MAPLKPSALAAMLAAAAPAQAETVASWRPSVAEASRRFNVPIAWIEQVMQAESAGRTALRGRPIVSPAGAMGLMQLMPQTWRRMRATLRLGHDAFDPHDNILAGTAFLRIMYDRFGYPGLFAAYNAGPGRYAAVLAGRRPLPAQTRAYLARVTDRAGATASVPPARSRATVFVALRSDRKDAIARVTVDLSDSLFAIRY